jgi:hypothetical protein
MVKHIHVPIPNQRSESATSHVIKEGAVRTALTVNPQTRLHNLRRHYVLASCGLRRNRNRARMAAGAQRDAVKAPGAAQLSPAQILLRDRLDEFDQRYAAQLQTSSNPDQLAIARIRAYATAYTAYLAQLEARP